MKPVKATTLLYIALIPESAQQVPSAFYLTDCFLWLDALLGKGMFIPDAENTRVTLAGQDAKRLKKLVGALRYLFRNSSWGINCTYVSPYFLCLFERRTATQLPELCFEFEANSIYKVRLAMMRTLQS